MKITKTLFKSPADWLNMIEELKELASVKLATKTVEEAVSKIVEPETYPCIVIYAPSYIEAIRFSDRKIMMEYIYPHDFE